MITRDSYSLFKSSSTTYFYSSLFFPRSIKEDVFTLYQFVRTADNFVDSVPYNHEGLQVFIEDYHRAMTGCSVSNAIISRYVALTKKYEFESEWTESFLKTMKSDINPPAYISLQDTIHYMYGSAEVIGLMMSKILNLPDKAFQFAQLLGRAMQYANFIRDIAEDIELDRNYFPQELLKKNGLANLKEPGINNKLKDKFVSFIREQIDIYYEWQTLAEQGFSYIPFRVRIPIKTASDMYKWTMRVIYNDPLIVYRMKVKPSRYRVIGQLCLNSIPF